MGAVKRVRMRMELGFVGAEAAREMAQGRKTAAVRVAKVPMRNIKVEDRIGGEERGDEVEVGLNGMRRIG